MLTFTRKYDQTPYQLSLSFETTETDGESFVADLRSNSSKTSSPTFTCGPFNRAVGSPVHTSSSQCSYSESFFTCDMELCARGQLLVSPNGKVKSWDKTTEKPGTSDLNFVGFGEFDTSSFVTKKKRCSCFNELFSNGRPCIDCAPNISVKSMESANSLSPDAVNEYEDLEKTTGSILSDLGFDVQLGSS